MSSPTLDLASTHLELPTLREFSRDVEAQALASLDGLAKPVGSLGKLEQVYGWWCGATGRLGRAPVRPRTVLFAADHGVVAQGVSTYESDVTARMVRSFLSGAGVINSFCAHYAVELQVVDVGVAGDLSGAATTEHAAFASRRVRAGTGDFTAELAMTREQAVAAVRVGMDCAAEAANAGVDVLAAGEMGIGNTTSASAVLSAIAAVPGKLSAGRGSGIDDAALARKVRAVDAGIARHQPARDDGIGVLSAVGGLEIAAIAGLCIGGAARGIPVVLDGFASTAGGLVASVLAPDCVPHLMVSHRSSESFHWAMSHYLRRDPILDLDMRLGEGVGAVMAVDAIRLAVRIANG